LSIPQLEQVFASGNQIAAIEAIRSFWGTGGVLFISLLILINYDTVNVNLWKMWDYKFKIKRGSK
jgi:uncharacterized membrane protein